MKSELVVEAVPAGPETEAEAEAEVESVGLVMLAVPLVPLLPVG